MKNITPCKTAESLVNLYSNLKPKLSLSIKTYEFEKTCSTEVLDWNHMDQNHRPLIHGHYQEESIIHAAEDALILKKKVSPSFFPIPLTTTIINTRIAPGLFNQATSFFNCIHFHIIQDWSQDKLSITCLIATPKILSFLHKRLHQKYHNALKRIEHQDMPLREQRQRLIDIGFRFTNTPPNFLNCNDWSYHVEFPKKKITRFINIENFEQTTRLETQDMSFYIQKSSHSEDGFYIWPSLCPHDGGPLPKTLNSCHESICPWHGLKFKATYFDEANNENWIIQNKIWGQYSKQNNYISIEYC